MAAKTFSTYLKELTVAKSDSFTANGENGTVYAVSEQTDTVEVSLESSAVGTRYTFLNQNPAGIDVRIFPATDETIRFWDVDQIREVVAGDDEWLEVKDGGSVQILKDSATNWSVVFLNNTFYND